MIGNSNDIKKVFFHISDVTDVNLTNSISTNEPPQDKILKVGDEVEFVLIHSSRNGKLTAIKIRKLASQSTTVDQEVLKRPDHLITKLKVANIDDKSGKQLILIRQPNNPDGKQKSFGKKKSERLPGSLIPLINSTERSITPQKREDSSDSNDKKSIMNLLISAQAESTQ